MSTNLLLPGHKAVPILVWLGGGNNYAVLIASSCVTLAEELAGTLVNIIN